MEKEHGPMCGTFIDGNGNRSTERKGRCNKPCTIPYEEHTSDKVCVLQLKRNCNNQELSAAMKKLVPIFKSDNID